MSPHGETGVYEAWRIATKLVASFAKASAKVGRDSAAAACFTSRGGCSACETSAVRGISDSSAELGLFLEVPSQSVAHA